jgi:regulator of RNase E activity RraA
VKELGFRLFSGSVAVSHSYAHIIEFGEPVEIGGLKIESGDLIHGDRQGVHTIPLSIAAAVAGEADKALAEQREFVDFCGSGQFSLEELAKRLQRTAPSCDFPRRNR